MVAAEQGISLLPASISRLVHPGVVFRKVKGAGFQFDHAFAFPTDGAKPAVKDLLALLPPVQD
jgi:hypothetical protein